MPKLVRYFDWWAAHRDVDGNALVVILQGWESGMDASPAYDAAYGITEPQPTFWRLYPRLLKTLLTYKLRYRWDQRAILRQPHGSQSLLDSGTFMVTDVGVNSVYAAGWRVLGELAAPFDPAMQAHCVSHQARVEKAILEHCYSESLGRFVSLYKDKEGRTQESTVETAQTLFPLLLTSLPRDIADRVVYGQLKSPEKFWRSFPVPSCAADSPHYHVSAIHSTYISHTSLVYMDADLILFAPVHY